MEDSYRHKGLRNKLVETVRRKGITDERVLKALDNVPRHLFMDSSFIRFSYQDNAFPIGAGQTISQPYTVAYQTQLLDIRPMDKVLEIGTGSGYQTAILMELGAVVYTIERQRELFLKSQELLGKLGYKPHFFFGDGMEGKKAYGPYDKILVTAGAGEIPENLLDQLKPGGIMVIPVGSRLTQSMVKIVMNEDGTWERTDHGSFVFVPLLKGTQE